MKYLRIYIGFLLMVSIVSGASLSFTEPSTYQISGSTSVNGAYSGFTGNITIAQLNLQNLTYNSSNIPIIYSNGFWSTVSTYDTRIISDGQYKFRVQFASDQSESASSDLVVLIDNNAELTPTISTSDDLEQAIKDLVVSSYLIEDDTLIYARSPYENQYETVEFRIRNYNKTATYNVYYELMIENNDDYDDGRVIAEETASISPKDYTINTDRVAAYEMLNGTQLRKYPQDAPYKSKIHLHIYLGNESDIDNIIFSTDPDLQDDINEIASSSRQEYFDALEVWIGSEESDFSNINNEVSTLVISGLSDIFGEEGQRAITITKTTYGIDSVTLMFKSGIVVDDIKTIGCSPSSGWVIGDREIDKNNYIIWSITFSDDGDYRVYVIGNTQYKIYSKYNTMNITISGIVDGVPRVRTSYYSGGSTSTSSTTSSSDAESLAAELRAKGLMTTPTAGNNTSSYVTKEDMSSIVSSAIADALRTPIPKTSTSVKGDGGLGMWLSIFLLVAIIIIGILLLWKGKSWISRKLNRFSDKKATETKVQPVFFDGESVVERPPSKRLLREFRGL